MSREKRARWKRTRLLQLARLVLAFVLGGWLLSGIVTGWSTISTLQALRDGGRETTAQVIGPDRLDPRQPSAVVTYAYRAGDTSVEDRFVAMRRDFPGFAFGAPLAVTYLPANPHVHRRGRVTDRTVETALLVSILFAAAGMLALGLPLLAVDVSLRRLTARPAPASSAEGR